MKPRNLVVLAVVVLLMGGCTSSSTPFYGSADGEVAVDDEGSDLNGPDLEGNSGTGGKVTGATAEGEAGGEVDSPPEPGEGGEGAGTGGESTSEEDADCTEDSGAFGCPCTSNADCDTGWCVSGLNGNVCTKPCLENCPEGWTCQAIQNLGGDLIYVCVPVVPELCLECEASSDCGSDLDLCMAVGGANVCGSARRGLGRCRVARALYSQLPQPSFL